MSRQRRLVAFVFALLAILAAAAGAGASGPRALVSPVVGDTPTSNPLPSGFVGLSMEFSAVREYTGSDPNAINPVLVQLIRNLAPGQAPVLRIGGDSTDQSWWPVPGVLPPGGILYPLTHGWLRTTAALTRTLGAKLIVGINLMLNRPALAAVEARALLAGLRGSVAALELGNEADLYGFAPWFRSARGKNIFGRSRAYSLPRFIENFSDVLHALPQAAPIAGPAFANLSWLSPGLGTFLAAARGLRLVTVHRYPLHGCGLTPSSQAFPTIANLLSDHSQSELAQTVAPFVAIAHSRRLPLRIDEMNSVSCAGTQGVSDTFASALWVLDTLFEMANVGVDGVNVHTLPTAHYEPFTFTDTGGIWSAFVHPEYYGMLLFAEAAPTGSRLLPIAGVPDGPLKVWATLAPDGTERIVLINEDASGPQAVVLRAPGSSATVEELTAPSVDATGGVTLGGQSFGAQTSTGMLAGQPQATTVSSVLGVYPITVPAASAAMLTLH